MKVLMLGEEASRERERPAIGSTEQWSRPRKGHLSLEKTDTRAVKRSVKWHSGRQ